MTESALESVLHEERLFPVPPEFAKQARIDRAAYDALVEEAHKDPEAYWARLAREHLVWDQDFQTTLDASNPPFYKWFTGGRLNASVQCLDKHVAGANRHKAALIWEAEDGEVLTYTYDQLHREVQRFSNVLLGLGVATGDRVAIYLPMIPEVVVAMLACARIGAPHSVVFGGFSSEALHGRLVDTGAKVVLTADGGYRGGKVVPLKANADKALAKSGHQVQHCVVVERTGEDVSMHADRDQWWHDLMADAPARSDPVSVDAEHPLYVLYTSGSTGKPKGIVHSTGGYMLWAKVSSEWVFDLKPDDVYWCTADVGWVTGHTYLVYGPLAAGATCMMYEGAPTYPDPGRLWNIVETHGVNVLYTAPTAIRALKRAGDEWPERHDLSSLRLLGTVGEPINPEAWMWYHATIGKGRCPIVDTWWQTETGGILITPLPGVQALKPGSCVNPLPGIAVDIVDSGREKVTDPERGGYLIVDKPWPSMIRTIWGDDDRFVETYWDRFDRTTYVPGDTAQRGADGYFRILGRFDDVLNVSGHRLGTMEIESALVSHKDVAEAAVVGYPHEVRGEGICAFVVTREGTDVDIETLRAHVAEEIGPIAKPDRVVLSPGLPKTRSGKIMRRIVRSLARGEEITQDVSTLEDSSVVEAIKKAM